MGHFRARIIALSYLAVLFFGLSSVGSPATAAVDRSGSYGVHALPPLLPAKNIPDPAITQKITEPFGNATTGISSGGLIRKWHDVQAGLVAEFRTINECRENPASCAAAPTRFLRLVENSRNLAGLALITEVNRAVNLAIRPMTDLAQHGKLELWSTPLMTFASGAGDCEDCAIAKYAALIQLGIPSDDLRLVVVYDGEARENHAVAAVRLQQRWLILDNRAVTVQADADSTHMNPLFVLGDQWVRRVDASANPPAVEDHGNASHFGVSDLPEALSISLGLIEPVI